MGDCAQGRPNSIFLSRCGSQWRETGAEGQPGKQQRSNNVPQHRQNLDQSQNAKPPSDSLPLPIHTGHERCPGLVNQIAPEANQSSSHGTERILNPPTYKLTDPRLKKPNPRTKEPNHLDWNRIHVR